MAQLPKFSQTNDVGFLEYCAFGFLRLWPDTGMEGLTWAMRRLSELNPERLDYLTDYLTFAYSRFAKWKRGEFIGANAQTLYHPVIPELHVERVYPDAINYAFGKVSELAQKNKLPKIVMMDLLNDIGFNLESAATYYDPSFWESARKSYVAALLISEEIPDSVKQKSSLWKYAKLGLGRYFMIRQEWIKARDVYESVLEKFPDHPTSTHFISIISQKLNSD